MECIICSNLINKMMKPYDTDLSTVLIDRRDTKQTIFSIVPKRCVKKSELSNEEFDDLKNVLKKITSSAKTHQILEDNKFRGEETIHYQIKVVVSSK